MLSFFKSKALGLIDTINDRIEPYEEFTRPLSLPPGESLTVDRLEQLRQYYEKDLQPFTSDDGALYTEVLPTDMGDLCIWQGIYAAYRSLAAAADPTSLRMAAEEKASRGLILYTSPRIVRGVSASPAPSHYLTDPTWQHFYYTQDGRLKREDASLDSFVGWLFGTACYLKFGKPSDAFKEHVASFARQFEKDGFRLLNRDGKMTLYGDCRPGILQGPVRTLAAVTCMRLGDLCGYRNDTWSTLAKRYEKEFERTATHFGWKRAWYNDHLAMLTNLSYALATEDGMPGRAGTLQGLKNLKYKHRKTGNAFLTYASALVGVVPTAQEQETATQVLLEFGGQAQPHNGKAQVPISNSTDSSVKKVKWGNALVAVQPLPAWQRPPADVFWQRSPYGLDGGGDARQYSGIDFLIAYWAKRVFEQG